MSDTTTYDSTAFGELQRRDQNILTRVGLYGYDPSGGGSPVNQIEYDRWVDRAENRGLDLGLAPDINSASDFMANIGAAGGNARQSRLLQNVSTQTQLAEAEQQKALYDEAVGLAGDALSAFNENNEHEVLIDAIRNLPSALSPEDMELLKRRSVAQARDDEVARLRRVRDVSGIGGVGGGSVAAGAARSARDADAQISSAFTQIELERLGRERSEMLEQTTMEAAIMDRRQNQLLALQQNYQNVILGQPTNSAQGMSDYSAFLEAVRAANQAENVARANSRDQLTGTVVGGLIEAGGDIASA
jgi:hypothetical protein